MSMRKNAWLMWLPGWRAPRDILAERIRDDAQARTKLPWAQRAYEILTFSVRLVQVCQHSGLGADLATHGTPLKRVGGIKAATGTDRGRRLPLREFCPKL